MERLEPDEPSALDPYAPLAPGTAWLLIFFAIPMGYMLIVSFRRATSAPGSS